VSQKVYSVRDTIYGVPFYVPKGVSQKGLALLGQEILDGPRWGAIAQFETEIRAERQREGIQKAKERGVRFGPAKKLGPAQNAELQQKRRGGVLIKTLMKEYYLSRSSVYRYLNEEIFPADIEDCVPAEKEPQRNKI
jgi:hypothetical protein